MKIPDATANVGAYYGNEENGQWQPHLQPNGVIIDSGVGGGIVGSGDAGVHRAPIYPVHIPRHMPGGYVMAGAFYPPQFAPPLHPQPDNFDDYMWMENEEEFDKQVIQQLQEEELMEQCIEAMLEDENRERRCGNQRVRDPQAPTTSSCNGNPPISLEETVSRSTLNPLAAEFVPTRIRLPPPTTTTNTDTKAESTEASSKEEPSTDAASDPDRASKPEPADQATTEVPVTPPKDPPEVSAADPQPPRDKTKPRDTKKPDLKKQTAKVEVKKLKPVVVKSEPKVLPKKKEVKELKAAKSEVKVEEEKAVKSEVKVEEEKAVKSEDAVDSVPKPQTQPPTPTEEPTFPGVKPINYAAAARAGKPKKAASPPAPAPAPAAVDKKREDKKPPKDKPKEKPVLRKNSAK